MPKPGVLPYPNAGQQLKRGFDRLADLLALTLGPVQGVVYSQDSKDGKPELLTDAATIARRMLQFPDRGEDVGAMLLRNLVWRVHLRAGDGAATAAVLAQAILDGAFRYRAAGANVMTLRDGIQAAGRAALAALQGMAWPVIAEDDLAAVAQSVTGEPGLSLVLGEIFDLLGSEAHVTIEDYVAPYLEREYHEGGRWKARLASPYLISDPPTRRAILAGCQVALFAGAVAQAGDVRQLLELAAGQPGKRLALIAYEIKSEALAALALNHRQGNLKLLAAELHRPGQHSFTDLQDLAVLTGATVLAPEAGRKLESIRAGDLGTARRVEADADETIVVGDGRQVTQVREQIALLRANLATFQEPDAQEQDELRLRLARLAGSMATLKIGAHTKVERAALRQRAEKALKTLPLALREGVAPGGGIAYVNCIPAVRQLALDGEAAWGADILARALEAPFRRIALNAGASAPAALLAEAHQRGPEYGYDARSGEIVDMAAAGILDATGVLRHALQTAISGAVMALTTDVVVLKRRPQTSYEP